MAKIINDYITVVAVIDKRGKMEYKPDRAFALIKSGEAKQVVEWNGSGAVLFYLIKGTGDVVYPADLSYEYLINGKLATPMDVMKQAISDGMQIKRGTVKDAATFLNDLGLKIKKNPNPTEKFILG